MAKVEKEMTEEMKEVVQESSEVVQDEKGYYVFPKFDVIINENGDTKPIEITAQRMLNMSNYNDALFKLQNDMNLREFAQTIFKTMIVKPAEARTGNFFNYDLEALTQVVAILIDIMGKLSKKIKRELNLILKQQKRSTTTK